MCIITTLIHDVSDLNYIVNTSLNLPLAANTSTSEQLIKNMWAISLDPEAIEKMNIEDFAKFLRKFLEKKIYEVSQMHIPQEYIGYPVIFYMWFDEMAAQLRFNTIFAFNGKLPFGCTLEILDSPDAILEDFLTSQYHGGIPWNEFEESDDNSDEDEQPFVLKVYVVQLN